MNNDVAPSTPITIDTLVPGGQGIATLPTGQKAFFWNALPNEVITSYRITKKKSHYIQAIATQITHTSPERIAPRDNCYLSTSPWQILNYDAELKYKTSLLQESFAQQGIHLDNPPLPVTDNHFYHYRNKMEYSLYWQHEDSRIYPAFYQRGSHIKTIITQSSLERPEIFQQALKIIAELNQRGEEARKYQSLLLRADQAGHVSGGLYEKYQPHPTFPPLSDTLLGYTYTYSVNGFFQINLPIYNLVLQEIAQHIQTNQVLDLYAGVGTIGLSVARDRMLTLVEVDSSAYEELKHNCQAISGNSVSSLKPVLARSEDVLEYITPDQTVILDPPRAGCDAKLINRLLTVKPPMIIYLSCNPATQARDAKALLEKYHISHVQPYNFFPRTPHLENLLILKLRKSAP